MPLMYKEVFCTVFLIVLKLLWWCLLCTLFLYSNIKCSVATLYANYAFCKIFKHNMFYLLFYPQLTIDTFPYWLQYNLVRVSFIEGNFRGFKVLGSAKPFPTSQVEICCDSALCEVHAEFSKHFPCVVYIADLLIIGILDYVWLYCLKSWLNYFIVMVMLGL